MKPKYVEELEQGFTPLTVCEEASRCLLCLDAPCSKACPAGTDPGKFIRSVRFRNFKGAAETVRENNALGAICARVCPTEKYCQLGCSRSGIDKPIDIGKIQRYITDFEESIGMDILRVENEDNGKSIGIVGSGPSALQASVELRKLGYKVVVYEKEEKLGGALRLIPEYRLPDRIIDVEIERIKKIGVEFKTKVNVGKDISLEEIKNRHDAIIIAAGFSKGKCLDLFKNNDNVEIAFDFLKRIKEGKGKEKVSNNILVIGGGDVAMDVNTTLKLLGCKNVTDVVYEEFCEFKASKKELENAQRLGVSIIDGYVPIEVNNKEVVFKHRVLDACLKIIADKIILAVGQYADVENLNLKLVKGEVNSKDVYLTDDPKVFVAGDLAHSPYDKTVVGGVRTGKEVAYLIDSKLGGKK